MRRIATGGGAAALIALLIAFVGPNEGLRTKAYLDSNGIATICYGETKDVELGDEMTADECKELFGKRLAEFARHVEACITQPMPLKVEAAFASLAYNIGAGGFCRSRVARLWNEQAQQEWPSPVYLRRAACFAIASIGTHDVSGHELPGLIRRRKQESNLCLEGLKEAA